MMRPRAVRSFINDCDHGAINRTWSPPANLPLLACPSIPFRIAPKAHDCVDALQALVRTIDVACIQAEQDRELSAGGIARRRAELSDQALRKLENFPPFEVAQKALSAAS